MKIQQVEQKTGLTAQSIRYYEREGLICPERNPENRYRAYTEADVQRLRIIAFCRGMGMSVSAIGRLLSGENTFQNCVEDALADARAEEASAREKAELCRAVLDQLQKDPLCSPETCVSALLSEPNVRYLYEQVLPPECRKPAPQRNWLFWIPGAVVVLIGLLIFIAVGSVAGFRTQRNHVLEWLVAEDAVVFFTWEEETVFAYTDEGKYLQNKLETLLLEPMPSQVLPGFRKGNHTVAVTINRAGMQAVLCLEELDGAVAVSWNSPDGSFRRVILNRGCKTILRQMRESLMKP